MIVIGLSGQKRSGKDTAAQMIQEYFPQAERLAFADKLKESIAALFNMSLEDIDRLKNMEERVAIDLWAGEPPNLEHHTLGSMRLMLQRMGTEVGRELFGERFWLDMAFAKTKPDGFYVITDCRFDNEAEYVRERGGVVWEIVRPSLESSDNHASEVPVDRKLIDDIIVNDGDLEIFRQKVFARLDRMKANVNTSRRG